MLRTPSPSRSMQRNQYSMLDADTGLWEKTWKFYTETEDAYKCVKQTWCLSSCPPLRWGTRQNRHNSAALPYTPACLWWNKSEINSETQLMRKRKWWVSLKLYRFPCFSYLVTVPENILSIILWEIARKNVAQRLLTIHAEKFSYKAALSVTVQLFHNTCNPFSQTVNPDWPVLLFLSFFILTIL